MILRTVIKPCKTTGRTKQRAIDKGPIGRAVVTSSSLFGFGYTELMKNDFVYVYTAQKFRGKRSNIVAERVTHWEVYTYRIPVAVLTSQNLHIVQLKNTFKFVKPNQ